MQSYSALLFVFFTFFSCKNTAIKSQNPIGQTINSTGDYLHFKSGVRSILNDRLGRYWIGSHNEGVCLFDGQHFTYFNSENGLSNNQVRSIYEDEQGFIWFECGEGVSYYDGFKMHTFTDYQYSLHPWVLTPHSLYFKGKNIIDYTEKERKPGMYQFDGKTMQYLAFPDSLRLYDQSYYSVSTPTIRGNNGNVWFGTYGAVIGYDGEVFTLFDDYQFKRLGGGGNMHVRSLCEDSKGNLWIGNNGIGCLCTHLAQSLIFHKK